MIELILRKAMRALDVPFVEQFRVRRLGRNARRSFYLDFAIPAKMIAIECDGKAYHTGKYAAYHAKRQSEMESMGWIFVRFTGSEICTSPESCAKIVQLKIGGSKP